MISLDFTYSDRLNRKRERTAMRLKWVWLHFIIFGLFHFPEGWISLFIYFQNGARLISTLPLSQFYLLRFITSFTRLQTYAHTGKCRHSHICVSIVNCVVSFFLSLSPLPLSLSLYIYIYIYIYIYHTHNKNKILVNTDEQTQKHFSREAIK